MILRIMLTTEFYSFWQRIAFFNLSYEKTNEFMFLVTFALNFLLIFLVQEQFGIVFSRREKYSFLAFYIVVYLMFLFIPRDIYNRYLTILIPVAVFTLELHAFFKIYFEGYNFKKYGIAVYWGIVLAIAGLFIDCYYINGNIYHNMSLALLTMLSLSLMIFSMVSALQIAEVYRDLAVSASRLAQARNQISIQKEYYDALSGQMIEIRMIRHDMRHFIGVIQRLSEEERYEELKQFLNEYSEKTETDSIPVYSENVVVNSILGYYSLKARDAGVPFHCCCSIPKQLSMNEIDLCIVLGNAMENSIEACIGIDDPDSRFISAEIRAWENKLLIKIKNSYNGIINYQDGRYLSTKDEKSRGIGMQNIKKIVEAHGGYIKTDHDGKIFTLMAAFPCYK